MTTETTSGNFAEDQDAIRLAKARLVRICRMSSPTAELALAQAATEQRTAVVAVAMRILAASAQDLAAGRVLQIGRHDKGMHVGRHAESRQVNRPMRPKQSRRPPRGQRGNGRR